MNNMEGRWGRRIYGTVERGPSVTVFTLVLEMRAGEMIHSRFRASNEDLEQWPGHYGHILDTMVKKIEEAINHAQGDHP